ncbi:MAG: preprotein translocase subunit SecE [Gammaproteobacteria bacterium]
MKIDTVEQISRWEPLKWVIIWGLIVAGLAANYYFSGIPFAYRLAAWLVFMGGVLFIASKTYRGQKAVLFAKEARIELRKVIWPTRQETFRTTLVVVAVVIIVALFLWGLDAFLLWGAGFLTGQRG